MTYDELIGHYRGVSEAGRAIGEDRRLVHSWRGRRIPSKHQIKFERLTGGVLKADEKALEDAAEFAGHGVEPRAAA